MFLSNNVSAVYGIHLGLENEEPGIAVLGVWDASQYTLEARAIFGINILHGTLVVL